MFGFSRNDHTHIFTIIICIPNIFRDIVQWKNTFCLVIGTSEFLIGIYANSIFVLLYQVVNLIKIGIIPFSLVYHQKFRAHQRHIHEDLGGFL
uniref:Uncharacterized protein n=1 Tax=Siphoviridae sp. ctL0q1 TaxID=2825449 RepID=A0A8S5PJN6_9CAUD|nr:MAG TPA: hypothetical protein [Siphoviridae sp. ctL0q1]